MDLKSVSALLDYNPDTGVFTWRVRRPNAAAGSVAGSARPDGYWKVSVRGKSFLAHRLAWLFITGQHPTGVVDHVNGDKLDNRAVNLRDVSQEDNMHNQRGLHKTNTSGFRGVSWNPSTAKWTAFISVKGKSKYLGQFPTPELAYEAYVAAKRDAHTSCNFNPTGLGE